MAEFSKYKACEVGRLFLHNNREKDDGVQHSNENIDNSRTVYNYHLKIGSPEDIKKRLSEIYVGSKREDAVVLGEMIVTLPKDVKKEDERNFFWSVYDFYSNEFGEENIINAVVHKDEIQPHLHLDFVPVLREEYSISPNSRCEKNIMKRWLETHNGELPRERLCCKKLIDQSYLAEMHQRLSEYVKEELGYEVGILNGATINGNKSVQQLKVETLKENADKLEKKLAYLKEEIGSVLTLAKKHGMEAGDMGLYPLVQKICDVENQNETLKSLIARQGYTWKKEELEAMQAKKYVPSKSVPVNVMDGSLVDSQIEKNAIVVIELPDKESRPSPQQKIINGDADLERQIKIIQGSAKQVMCRTSRTSDRIYLYFKTDSEKQTMENLLLMERQLLELDRKGRKVYIDKIETDIYDLARAILMKNQIEALYFTNIQLAEKNKSNTKSLSQEM